MTPSTASEYHDVSRTSHHNPSWTYSRGTITTIALPSNFNNSPTYITHFYKTIHAHTQPESSCTQQERVIVSQWPETVHASVNASNTPSGLCPQKLERPIMTQVCGLCQPHSWWLAAALSTLMTTKSLYLQRHNDIYKVACSGESISCRWLPTKTPMSTAGFEKLFLQLA